MIDYYVVENNIYRLEDTPGNSMGWLRLFLNGKLIDSLSYSVNCYYEYSVAKEFIMSRNSLKTEYRV